MSSRDPFTIVLVLLVYVLPLGGAVALLFAVGLPVIAVSLLVVEAVVAVAVLIAKRPARTRTTGPRPGWFVPAMMAAVLLGLVGVAVVGARFG